MTKRPAARQDRITPCLLAAARPALIVRMEDGVLDALGIDEPWPVGASVLATLADGLCTRTATGCTPQGYRDVASVLDALAASPLARQELAS